MTTQTILKAIGIGLGLLLLASCGEAEIPEPPAQMIDLDGTALIHSAGSDADLGAFSSDDWKAYTFRQMDLEYAPPVHPSVELRTVEDAPVLPFQFKAAAAGNDTFLDFKWPDATENSINSFEKFSDGVAVQFALPGSDYVSHMMGDPEGPVNIWYWKAGVDAPENLVAFGFGTTTRLDNDAISIASNGYADGHWHVVFKRATTATDDSQANLSAPVQAAFAVWQGEDKERDGLKRTTPGWIVLAPATDVASTQE